MSHTEMRTQVDEWEVEVCDNCTHDEGQHYKESTEDVGWIWEGCMVLSTKPNARLLKSTGKPFQYSWREREGEEESARLGFNPYPRCFCTEFK